MEKPLYTGDGSDLRPFYISDGWRDVRVQYSGKRIKPIITRSQMRAIVEKLTRMYCSRGSFEFR